VTCKFIDLSFDFREVGCVHLLQRLHL